MEHIPSGIDLLSVPPIARAVGTALSVLAPGARVVAHGLGCHLLRCGVCSCTPFFTAPMGRA